MKKLMYLSISIFFLSMSALIGFHVGSNSVLAQAPDSNFEFSCNGIMQYVMLSNGDCYYNTTSHYDSGPYQNSTPVFLGNFWTGSTVPSAPTSMGKLKSDFNE